ncbi:terminase small subunit [Bradyrhizobium retamae]|uniref:terminase small subunit n=1 Tax=Bradyrhizobium retamae TaxID=1300035 RepID=UPI0009E90611|nr:terminase small subunit [Bradyrhizobium retamae]
MPALTPKQRRFVEEYLLDMCAGKAAIRAGYSKKTANQQGHILLDHPGIKAAIDAAKIKRSEKTETDAAWVLKRLVAEAEADLADLYDESGDLKPIDEWPEIWRQGLVAGVEIDALYEGSGEDRKQVGHVKKIKLSDRLRRLELIGKHVRVNAFQEQVKIAGVDELAERLARVKAIANADRLAPPVTPAALLAPPAMPAATVVPASEAAPAERAEPAAPPPKPAYKPIMPPTPEPVMWPSFGGTANSDYDPLT